MSWAQRRVDPGTRERRATLSVVTAACALLIASSSAWADRAELVPRPKDPDAVRLLREGFRYYEAGEFEEAIEVYKKSARIEPSMAAHFNMAQCLRRLKRYDEAIFHYERLLSDARVHEKVKVHVRRFIREMKDEQASAASSKPPTGPAESLGSGSGGSGASSPPQDRPSPGRKRLVAWTSVGLGGALLLTGAALQMRASSLYDQADGEQDQQEYLRLTGSAKSSRTWGTASLIVGGGAVAAGVVLYVMSRRSARTATQDQTSIHIGPTSVGLAVSF